MTLKTYAANADHYRNDFKKASKEINQIKSLDNLDKWSQKYKVDAPYQKETNQNLNQITTTDATQFNTTIQKAFQNHENWHKLKELKDQTQLRVEGYEDNSI